MLHEMQQDAPSIPACYPYPARPSLRRICCSTSPPDLVRCSATAAKENSPARRLVVGTRVFAVPGPRAFRLIVAALSNVTGDFDLHDENGALARCSFDCSVGNLEIDAPGSVLNNE